MTQRRQFVCLLATASVPCRAVAAPVEQADKDHTLLFPNYFVSPVFNRYVRIMEAAYAAMGYRAVFEIMPTERGLVESTSGIAAGEIARIPNIIEKQFPQLLRVPVQLDWLSISSFTKASTRAAPNLAEASKLRVGMVRGIKIFEAWTHDWPHAERVGSSAQLLKMLAAGNVDVAIGFTDDLGNVMAEIGMNPQQFDTREIEKLPQYHYLHQRHAALIPADSAELKKIKGNYPTVVEGFKARGDK
jgi:polar amino acid transport system substrate-binding protein